MRGLLFYIGFHIPSNSKSHTWLVVLLLNIPVTNFSVMSGWRHYFLSVTRTLGEEMCLPEGHNTAEIILYLHVGVDPYISCSGIIDSTNRAPHSPKSETVSL